MNRGSLFRGRGRSCVAIILRTNTIEQNISIPIEMFTRARNYNASLVRFFRMQKTMFKTNLNQNNFNFPEDHNKIFDTTSIQAIYLAFNTAA